MSSYAKSRILLAIAVTAIVLSAVAGLDPRCFSGAILGPLLATAGLILARRWGMSSHKYWLSCALSVAFGIAHLAPADYSGDALAYYVYLPSLTFDRDLDLANNLARLGVHAFPLSPTGLSASAYAVGPAVIWLPFYLLAHLYATVVHFFGGPWAPDGVSAPYLCSTRVGTLTITVIGVLLLARTLSIRFAPRLAALAAIGAVVTSPVIYYLFINATTSHGLAFGLAAALVWAIEAAHRQPDVRRWIIVGALLGVLCAVRWQAIVMALAPLLVGFIDLGQRRVTLRALLAGCGAALVAFSPQMFVWKLLYGQFIWIPRNYGGLLGHGGGGHWFNPRSPRALDVLLSADRGFFTWTPVMLLLSIGLLLAVRRWRMLTCAGLLVFAATTWVNGSLGDWQSADSFGARRFDLIIPFLALGLARLLELGARHPLRLSAVVLSLAALWNIGVVSLKTRGILKTAAPLHRVAASQARQLRGVSETWLERLVGPSGRSLAYRFFVGEYFYWNTNPAGTINVAHPECPYLAGGWSSSQNAAGPPTFRWALYPSACVRFPFDYPLSDLRATIRARAPARLPNQIMTVGLNGVVLQLSALSADWTETKVVLPGRLLLSGENRLCLSFDQYLERDGRKIAAAIAVIQLP